MTFFGTVHRAGETVDLKDGRIPVGLEPLDDEARKLKRDSIDERTIDICNSRPGRWLMLARSLGEDSSSFDRARAGVLEWMKEQGSE